MDSTEKDNICTHGEQKVMSFSLNHDLGTIYLKITDLLLLLSLQSSNITEQLSYNCSHPFGQGLSNCFPKEERI